MRGSTTADGLVTWVGGRLVAAAEAVVSAHDRGFRSGEGVFETLRAYGSHPFRLAEHIARATSGAKALGFEAGPADELAAAVLATAEANLAVFDGADSALRLTITPGGIVLGSPFPGTPLSENTVVVSSQRLVLDPAMYRDGIAAVTVPWMRELPHVKPISYLMAAQAHREALRRGATEGLLTDPDGTVLEGSGSNVFAVFDGVLVTPPLSAGLLAGITRATVLDLAPQLGLEVRERLLPRRKLLVADEAFLTASTREVVPIVTVDGTPIGSGRPGPVTATVHKAFQEEVAREVGATTASAG